MANRPYEVLLNTEQMCFLVENQFGHDPALHDWGPTTANTGDMAGKRINEVFQQNPHLVQNGGSNQVSTELVQATNSDVIGMDQFLEQGVGCTAEDMYVRLNLQTFEVTDVIMLDRTSIRVLIESGGNILGYAPGYVHTTDGTYPPFNFEYAVVENKIGFAHQVRVEGEPQPIQRIIYINIEAVQYPEAQSLSLDPGNLLTVEFVGQRYYYINLKGIGPALNEQQLQLIIGQLQSRYGDILASYINTNTQTKYENYRNYLESGILGSETRFNLLQKQDQQVVEKMINLLQLDQQLAQAPRPTGVPLATIRNGTHQFFEAFTQNVAYQLGANLEDFEANVNVDSPQGANELMGKVTTITNPLINMYKELEVALKTFAIMLEPIIITYNGTKSCLPNELRCKPILQPTEAGGFSCRVEDLSVNTLVSKLCLNTLPQLQPDSGSADNIEDVINSFLKIFNVFTNSVNLINNLTIQFLSTLPEPMQAYWCLLRISELGLVQWVGPASSQNPYKLTELGAYLSVKPLNDIPPNMNEVIKQQLQDAIKQYNTANPESAFTETVNNYIIIKRLLETANGTSWNNPESNVCNEIAGYFGKAIFVVNKPIQQNDQASLIRSVVDDAISPESINITRNIMKMNSVVNNFKITLNEILAKLQSAVDNENEANEMKEERLLTEMQHSQLLSTLAIKEYFLDPSEIVNPAEQAEVGQKVPAMFKYVRDRTPGVVAYEKQYFFDLFALRSAQDPEADQNTQNIINTLLAIIAGQEKIDGDPNEQVLETLKQINAVQFQHDTGSPPFPMTMANVPPQQQIEILRYMQNITLTMLGEVTDEVLINFIREFFSSDGDLQNILPRGGAGAKKQLRLQGGGKKVNDKVFIPIVNNTIEKLTNAGMTGTMPTSRQTKSLITNTLISMITNSNYPDAIKQRILAESQTSNWRFDINKMYYFYFTGFEQVMADVNTAKEVIEGFGRYPLYLTETNVTELILPTKVAKNIFNTSIASDLKSNLEGIYVRTAEITDLAYKGQNYEQQLVALGQGLSQANAGIPGLVKEDRTANTPEEYEDMITLQKSIGQMFNDIIFLVFWVQNWNNIQMMPQLKSQTDQQLFQPIDFSIVGPYLMLLTQMLIVYNKLIDKAVELVETESKPLAPQVKTAAGYALGAILISVKTEVEPFRKNLSEKPLLALQDKLISQVLEEKAGARTKLQGLTFGDRDTTLYKGFVNYLKDPSLSKNWIDKAKFYATSLQPGTKVSELMFTTLSKADGWEDKKGLTGQMLQTSVGNPGEAKYYINNAVTAKKELGFLMSEYFCPIFSVMDNMPQCGNAKTAALVNGYEWGELDVVIHDGKSFFDGSSTSGSKMSYRIRVIPADFGSNRIPETAHIAAYLKIGDTLVINVGRGLVEGLKGNFAWPDVANASDYISCSLRKGDPNPLDAKTCLNTVLTLLNNPPFSTLKKMGYDRLLDYMAIEDNNPSQKADMEKFLNQAFGDNHPKPSQLRRALLEKSFQKGLGDTLQELAGVVANSGYIGNYGKVGAIASPETKRLQLSNDRPSGIRAILLLLYGRGDINPNAVAGYLTKNRYAIAARAKGGGKGGRTKKKRTRRKVKKKKKTRKAKPKRGKTRKARKPKKKTRGKRNNKKSTK